MARSAEGQPPSGRRRSPCAAATTIERLTLALNGAPMRLIAAGLE
jgi:hypothetical protein